MSSFGLKILAIILMTIDHIGFLLFPKIKLLRSIGRLAFPIFAFQLGVGFKNTKSKEKYIFRMLMFTIISQIPFDLALQTATLGHEPLLNIGATLTLGLLALYCLEKFDNKWIKYISVFLVILLSAFIPIDYGWMGVLLIVVLYFINIDKLFGAIFFVLLVISDCKLDNSLFNLPQIFALIPILSYNGKKGKNIKYLFYAFYPLHLLALVAIRHLFF